MKIFAICSIFFMLFFQGGGMKNNYSFENITDSFRYVSSVNVIIDNNKSCFKQGEDEFCEIMKTLADVTEYSHDMPAFGVSFDYLTKEEVKSGLWLELGFEKTLVFNEMPFDSLLIKVEKDIYGFNLIRGNGGAYEGRCFYLSLNGSMNKLYSIINSFNAK